MFHSHENVSQLDAITPIPDNLPLAKRARSPPILIVAAQTVISSQSLLSQFPSNLSVPYCGSVSPYPFGQGRSYVLFPSEVLDICSRFLFLSRANKFFDV